MKIKITGIRPGEKISEILCSKDEFFNTLEFSDHYVIKPSIKFVDINIDYKKNNLGQKGKYVSRNFEYSSSKNNDFLSIKELKSFITNFEKTK